MFNSFLLILLITFTGFWTTPSWAQNIKPTFEQIESDMIIVKNPFKSQLPEPPPEPTPEPTPEPIEHIEENPVINPEPVFTPDPVKPVVNLPPPLPKDLYVISGVIWDSERPQAIVDGRIVEIGTNLEGIIIKDIKKTGLTGEFFGKTVTINHEGARYDH